MRKTVDKVAELLLARKELANAYDLAFAEQIAHAADLMTRALKKGKKLLIFGNGGSAAEAQHFAAELVCKFERERKAIPALALTTDTSTLTAVGNDYGYGHVFSRQIEALGRPGDVAVAMTTSDALDGDPHSENILNGLYIARANRLVTIGLFSSKTKNLLKLVDHAVIAPHTNTALIQEAHLAVVHIVSGLIEETLACR